MKWVDVTDSFSLEQRYYKDTFLEIDEILGDTIEVRFFHQK